MDYIPRANTLSVPQKSLSSLSIPHFLKIPYQTSFLFFFPFSLTFIQFEA
jgi:hypothetical protein